MNDATVADVLQILNAHSIEVLNKLKLPIRQVQLSMPRDDRGPRIKVSVTEDSKLRLPSQFSFDLSGRKVLVKLERANDFQDYQSF